MEKLDGDTEILDIPDSFEAMDDSEEAVVLDTDDDGDDVVVNGSVSCKQWRSGYIRKGVYAVCAPTHSATVKTSDDSSCVVSGSIQFDSFSQKQLEIEDEVSCEREVLQCNGHRNNVDNKTMKTQDLNKPPNSNLIGDNDIFENKCEALENEKGSMLHSNSDQEYEDLSQANAFDFVDQYLSLNSSHFLEKDSSGKTSRLKSPPVSCAKGSKKLARRVIIGTSCDLSRTFEWDGDHVDMIEENVLQNKDINSKLDGSKMSFIEEVDDEPSKEKSLQIEGDLGGNVPDSCDVGFDTQMAAEAMEALSYAPIIRNSSVDKETCSNSEIAKRKLKQKNMFFKSLNGQRSKFTEMNEKELDPELLGSKKGEKRKRWKSLAKTESNFLLPINVSVQPCNSSVNLIKRGKKAKALKREDINEVAKDFISSCRRVPLQNKKRKLSIPQEMDGGIELGLPKRRQNIEKAEILPFFTVKKRRSTTCILSSGETGNVKASQKKQKYDNLEPVGCHWNLDLWSFPKGKRKNRNARQQWNALSSGPTLAKEETGPDSSIDTCKRPEENSKNRFLKVYVRKKSRPLVNGHQVESTKELNCEDLLRENSRNNCLQVYVRRKLRPLVYDHQVQTVVEFTNEDFPSPNSEVKSSRNVLYHNFCVANKEISVPSEDNFEASRLGVRKDSVGPTSPVTCANKLLEKPQNAKVSLSGSENNDKVSDKKCSKVALKKELPGLDISDSVLTNESKNSRKRREMKNIRVLFSQNMDEAIVKKQKKILGKLGSFIASSCSEATHFVTDRFMRTKNMLEAIALGKPVVTHLWIESCGQAKFFVDEKNYILRDAKKEREFGFSMPVSLASARKAPLLKGRRVYVTPNIKPGKEMIVSLVKAVHGEIWSEAEDTFHETDKKEMISDDILVLSCEQDYALCAPFLEQGAAVCSSELLLNGIIIQKLEFEMYQIFQKPLQG